MVLKSFDDFFHNSDKRVRLRTLAHVNKETKAKDINSKQMIIFANLFCANMNDSIDLTKNYDQLFIKSLAKRFNMVRFKFMTTETDLCEQTEY